MRLLILLFLAAPVGFAQSSAAYIEQAGVSLEASAQDIALIGAVAGQDLDRTLFGGLTPANAATISVDGHWNRARLDQQGAGNQFALSIVGSGNEVQFRQSGYDNVFLGDITGDANRLVDSEQTGTGNSYLLLLEGVDATVHSVRQIGPGNTASQVVGPGLTPVSIEQFGGATISIVRR